MKSLSKMMLTIAGVATLGTSAALAAPPVNGDLLLGVRATGGTGSTTNVFVNLGPAHAFRDNAAQGVVANINAELTAAFGAGWYTRSDVYFGVIANKSAGSSTPDANGDPTRTFYLSKQTTSPGASTAHTGYSSSSLGSAGTKLTGTVTAVAALTESQPNVTTMSQAVNPTQWANSWSTWNPVPGASYTIFTGGIQNNFGKGTPYTYVDVQRLAGPTPPATAAGVFVGAIGLNSAGDVFLTSGEVTINPTVTTAANKNGGTVTGGGTIVAGQVTTFEAIPNPGNSFARWVVTRANGDKEFYTDAELDIALFEGDKIQAEFAKMSGKFTGVAVEIPAAHATSGFASVSLAASGKLSAGVAFGGQKWGYKGTLAAAQGGVVLTNKSGNGPTLTVTSAVGTQIEGNINGVPFSLEKMLWKKTSNEYDFGGLHTACLAEDMVAEYGYSLIKISGTSGAATVKGQLPDGTKYTSGTVVSGVDNSLPVYGLIKGGASSVFGILIPSVVTAVTLWDGDVNVLGAIGPVELVAQGSEYEQPLPASPIVGASDFLASISQATGGSPDLGFVPASLLGLLGNAPAVTTPATAYTLVFSGAEDPSSATVFFNVKTGATKFQFVHPVTLKKVTGYGAVVQHQLNGAEDGVEAGMGCGVYLVKQKVGSVTTAYPGWMAFDDVGIE
jgi:hypothetical protein